MKSRITITSLNPCGCESEGDVCFRFEGEAREFHGYYQASDEEARRCFAPGSQLDCFVRMVWGELLSDVPATGAIESTNSHEYDVRGAFRGWIEYDGDRYAAVDAGRLILVAPEGGDPAPDVGDPVRVRGAFQLECP
jgi:hypothetical protein